MDRAELRRLNGGVYRGGQAESRTIELDQCISVFPSRGPYLENRRDVFRRDFSEYAHNKSSLIVRRITEDLG